MGRVRDVGVGSGLVSEKYSAAIRQGPRLTLGSKWNEEHGRPNQHCQVSFFRLGTGSHQVWQSGGGVVSHQVCLQKRIKCYHMRLCLQKRMVMEMVFLDQMF